MRKGTKSMTWLTTAIATIWTTVTDCITHMTGNEYLALFLAGSVIALGFKIFRSAKKSAKR